MSRLCSKNGEANIVNMNKVLNVVETGWLMIIFASNAAALKKKKLSHSWDIVK